MALSKISSVVAEIRYYTNYSDPSAPVIRLGAIAEAVTDKTRVLAMLGRAELTAEELAPVSGFNRSELEDVWGMLSRAFRSAWEKRPAFSDAADIRAGSMLAYLAETHSMSLHFDPPRRFVLPRATVEHVERRPKELGNSVLRFLEAQLKPRKIAPARRVGTPRARAVARTLRPFRETSSTEAVAQL